MGRSEALYFGDSLELTLTSVIGSRKILAGRIIITSEPGVSWGGPFLQSVRIMCSGGFSSECSKKIHG
jgi:hypothetical protein